MAANAIRRLFLAAVVLVLLPGAARTGSDEDIVWPTYSQVTKAGDADLTCAQLRGAIAHVTSDIAMLTKARQRVEDIIQSQITYNRSHGTPDSLGKFNFETSDGGSEKGYVQAHYQIGVSHGIAVKRLDYLNMLLKTCKNAAPGGGALKPSE